MDEIQDQDLKGEVSAMLDLFQKMSFEEDENSLGQVFL